MSSSLKGRQSVYIIDLPVGWQPQSPFATPEVFHAGEAYARKLPAYAAIGFALAFNKHQLANRLADRKWAITIIGRPVNGAPLDAWAMEDREQALAKAGAIDTSGTDSGREVAP